MPALKSLISSRQPTSTRAESTDMNASPDRNIDIVIADNATVRRRLSRRRAMSAPIGSGTNLFDLDRVRLEDFFEQVARREALSRPPGDEVDPSPVRHRFRRDDRPRQGAACKARTARACAAADGAVRQGVHRRHAQVAAGHGPAQRHRGRVHPRQGPRHALRLLAGRLRVELPVLLDRHAGLQPQPLDGRDHRPGVGRGASPGQRPAPAAQADQRGDDGDGRAAHEFRQRRSRDEHHARRPGLRPRQQARRRCRPPAWCR